MARHLTLSSPLGDALTIIDMRGSEQLGRLFRYALRLASHDESIDANQLLGQTLTLTLEVEEGAPRHFHGYVGSFSYVGRTASGQAEYSAVIYPWLWLLTHKSDCRIFQDKSIPDILKEIFSENGFTDYENALSGSYPVLEYCVQYRETTFEFVSRLMEEAGIYYFFHHEETKHSLVLADNYNSHGVIPGQSDIRYHQTDIDLRTNEASLSQWVLNTQVQTGAFALNDYDFKKPKSDLHNTRTVSREHAFAEAEQYDHPGGYVVAADGEQVALTRIEELQANHQVATAVTDARTMMAGGLFKLQEHPRDDQNKEYLATQCSFVLVNTDGHEFVAEPYVCQVTAIDSKTPFRTPRSTRKPIVYGPNTAVVVGPAGEEIYPDEYGRVKVQFHWDRHGASDETSSCWIRVAQTWAGAKWGAQFIPRIGQEVMVEFFEGDPDRPVITGRVYNGDNMPPYSLPDNKTQSGIKSRSSPGGADSNFNEIRMEDKKGSEELFIQAEKDRTVNVKNNNTETVGVDEVITIGNDQTLTVGNDQSATIGNNQTLLVGNDQTETVVANRTRTVGANEAVTVNSSRTHTVAVNEAVTVGAAQEITVGGLQAITVGAAQAITVGAAQQVSIGGMQSTDIGVTQSVSVGSNQSFDVGGNQSISVGGGRTVSVGKDESVTVGKNLTISAGDSITITCGKASIVMNKDGTITIGGKDMTMDGSGAINMKAAKDIVMKGKKILQN